MLLCKHMLYRRMHPSHEHPSREHHDCHRCELRFLRLMHHVVPFNMRSLLQHLVQKAVPSR